MGRGTSLGYLPPIEKAFASLSKDWVGSDVPSEHDATWCFVSYTEATYWVVACQWWHHWNKVGELITGYLSIHKKLMVAQAFSKSVRVTSTKSMKTKG